MGPDQRWLRTVVNHLRSRYVPGKAVAVAWQLRRHELHQRRRKRHAAIAEEAPVYQSWAAIPPNRDSEEASNGDTNRRPEGALSHRVRVHGLHAALRDA